MDGRFSFGDLDVRGPDTLVIRHLAYDSMRLSLGVADLGPLDLELVLKARPLPLPGLEVSVEARREARRLADLLDGDLWERADFERYTASADQAVDLLRWSGKVTFVDEGAEGYRCVVIRMGAPCALILVNNVMTPSSALLDAAPEDVESFVVLSATEAATAYGTGTSGGVVVIFTRGR